MRHNPFENQLERLARTLTEQFGVNVLCQGQEAWTDGKQIVLPSLPEPMDQDLEKMVLGFLDHEMAHVAFSDFGEVKEFSQKHPGYEAMLNVVEDALIERRAMERWPGVRANLDSMFAQIRDRIAKLVAKRDPFGQFCTAVYLKLSHHSDMLGLDAQILGYDDLFDWFPSVVDTHGAAGLASQILKRWLRQPQAAANSSNADQPSGDAASKQNGEGTTTARGSNSPRGIDSNVTESKMPQASQEPNDAESAGTDDGRQTSSLTDQPSAAAPEAKTASDPEQSEKDGEVGGSGDAESTGLRGSEFPAVDQKGELSLHGTGGLTSVSLITEVLAESIAERASQLETSSTYRVYTKAHDRITSIPFANDAEVLSLQHTHQDVVRRLRRGLANALRSAEKRWWRDDQLRGSLSPKTLHRLRMDRPRLDIFRNKATVQGRSTAVSILLDASGSMTRRKMEVARDALRVLLEAFADLKVASEALTFTTGREVALSSVTQTIGADPSELRKRYSRFANLEIGIVKSFDETVKLAMRRLPGICGSGLTPLGEAMQVAARRLFPRSEFRKILLVLTDGRAGCEGNDGSAVQHAQHPAEQINKAGIELIGIGILDDSLRAIVADTIVVHQLEDLPAQLCKLLSQALLKGLRHVG